MRPDMSETITGQRQTGDDAKKRLVSDLQPLPVRRQQDGSDPPGQEDRDADVRLECRIGRRLAESA